MFTDQTHYWIERVHRFSDTQLLLHKGQGLNLPSPGIGQNQYLPVLSNDWTWYIIQMDGETSPSDPLHWKAWRANVGIRGIGGGYVRYDTTESDYVHVGGTTATFGTILNNLRGDRVIVALVPDATFIPSL